MSTPKTEQAAIQIRGLVKSFGRFQLGPIDLDVPAGYVTGLVGVNGAGKTSLLKAMLGLLRTDSGTVHSFTGSRTGLAAEDAGVVFDHPTVIPEWTARRSGAALAPFFPRWDAALFAELLERFRVTPSARVGTLSHGETTKLSLALALARQPRLLILDEPTSGLDPAARRTVLDLFGEFMAADDRRTILFSTHITSDLERIADHLCILSEGRVIDAGPLEEVVERYAMVRGPSPALPATARSNVHGLREVSDTFDGLIAADNTALFGPDVLVEPACIDDIVAHLSQPVDRVSLP